MEGKAGETLAPEAHPSTGESAETPSEGSPGGTEKQTVAEPAEEEVQDDKGAGGKCLETGKADSKGGAGEDKPCVWC